MNEILNETSAETNSNMINPEVSAEIASETTINEDPVIAARKLVEQMFAEEGNAQDEHPSVDEETPTNETPTENVEENKEALQEETQAQVEEPKKDKLSSRFAALAKEEKRIREQREQLKAEQKEIEKFKSAISKIKTNPLEALEELGIDYESLTKSVLLGGKPDPEDEIKALKAQYEQFIKEQREAQERLKEAEVQRIFEQTKYDIAQYVKTASDKYPLASNWDEKEVAESALQLIQIHFNKTGTVLSFDDALQEIENRLESLRNKFIKHIPTNNNPPSIQNQSPKAITNKISSQQGNGKSLEDMTMEERIAYARKMIEQGKI